MDSCAPSSRFQNIIGACAECAFGAVPNLLATSLCFSPAARGRTAQCAGSHARFFADLIEHRIYSRADPTKGRFRSFLLGTLKHFLADAREHNRAQKRGGGSVPV